MSAYVRTTYGVMICNGDHDSSDECDWRHFYNADDYLAAVQRADAAEARIAALEAALKSIASNTCCDGCREAALVAQAALSQEDK